MNPGRSRMVGFLECEANPDGSLKLPDLTCPRGHTISWEFAFHEAGYPRCLHENSSGHRDCEARLFVQFFQRKNPRAHALMFVAEMSYAEIAWVTNKGYDVPQIMEYLGLWWAPKAA